MVVSRSRRWTCDSPLSTPSGVPGMSIFFFSSRRRHTRCSRDWSSDVCSSDLLDGSQFEMNLFDPVPADSLNSLEREVASFLDEQSRLYFWYRNIPRRGHYVQG